MAAAMAVAALLDRGLGRVAGLLAEARQGIEFAHDRDDRAAFAGFADDRRREACDAGRDAKTFAFQHGAVLGGRADLLIVQLGHVPDAVGEPEIGRGLVVDPTPDILAVAHG